MSAWEISVTKNSIPCPGSHTQPCGLLLLLCNGLRRSTQVCVHRVSRALSQVIPRQASDTYFGISAQHCSGQHKQSITMAYRRRKPNP
ncbi:hypothetical protein AV530_008653 [Patagioenas fasciata monilis]|uniref:Uncharacterized protein n=1 Tax=Patagioenas fasciata monilis TaxID=372326 RepID=A0A1V4L0U3_PATFA|nr:hypothetical protein AV530_008653 [Patagioenas fasciata monilis]